MVSNMAGVLHVGFRGELPADPEYEHPPGVSLARILETRFRSRFNSVDEFDNWRDCGWSLRVHFGDKTFEVYFALYYPEKNQWLLAILPLGQPGIIGRLFGRKPFRYRAELEAIVTEVNSVLTEISSVSDIRWRFGGPPWTLSNAPCFEDLIWPDDL